MDRKDIGSWLEGPPTDPDYEPGSAIGLPAQGVGSPAPFVRRVLSLFLDWGACMALSAVFFSFHEMWTLGLFAAVNVVALTLIGATPGQLVVGVRVTPVRGQLPMIARALIRTALMLLIVPAVIWNKDQQPLHDVAAGTAVVRA